jgi:uncharacterized protein
MKNINLALQQEKIEAFCKKYCVRELSLFGSVLREDFRADSDVDVLLVFEPGSGVTFDNFLDIRDDLSAIFGGRSVDVMEKRLLKNPFRRHEILTTREVVYAA